MFAINNLILASTSMSFFDKMSETFAIIFAQIPKIFYLLVTFFLQLLDILQLIFKKLAGLDVFYVDGQAQSGDILNELVRSILIEKGALNTAFWGIAIIGLFLLFLSTFVAVLRT